MKRLVKFIPGCTCSFLAILLLLTSNATATENGVNSGALGAEDFMTGALPPNGFYYLNYFMYYTSNTLKNNSGNTVPGNNRLDATADINRFVYVTKYKFLGADVGLQLIVPLVNLKLDVTTPIGQLSGSDFNVGDLVVTPILLGWHWTNFHCVFATDVFLATAPFDKNNVVSVGRNYYSTELAFAFTYMFPYGIEFSSKLMYDINFKNPSTDYTSGNEFHLDALLGFHATEHLMFGANAYFYQQVTNDAVGGDYTGAPIMDGNRGRVFGIGPALLMHYDRFTLTAKYQAETFTKNRFEGDRFWLKLIIPF